jgi:LmbE family N-acetylglucosaminyl deacetylase
MVAGAIGCAVWVLGVLFTSDLGVPIGDVRRFKNVLVIFPHADDETVSCGGSIRKMATCDAHVTLVLLTGGECGNPAGMPDMQLKHARRREAEHVAKILGVSRLIQKDYGDGQLAYRSAEIQEFLVMTVRQVEPDLIVTYDQSGLDGHVDHVACSEVITALRTAHFRAIPLWYVSMPLRLVRLLTSVGQMSADSQIGARRCLPTHRVFLGVSTIAKVRALYAYRSQRGAIAKGLGKVVPVWLAVSMMQFEYFAEAA